MPLEIQQIQRPEQRMVLSPQMQQAIYLLQVPLQELSTIIRQEMVENPILEDSQETLQNTEEPEREREELEFEEEFDRLARMDEEWKDYFFQERSIRRGRHGGLTDETREYLESLITGDESLSEHLLKQLNTSALTDEKLKIGEAIIGNLDDNGYLIASLEEISEETKAGTEEVEAVLRLIQSFHPVGVAARNLKECLLNQIDTLNGADPIAREIVDQMLKELGERKYPAIARRLNTTPERIQAAAEFIATLEPKPGRIFGADNTQYITPDIFLEKDEEEDDYRIIFNSDYTPHLRISRQYRRLLRSEGAKNETKEYIRNKLKSGLWLIKNIQLRRDTLYKITREIVKRQKQFLDKGIAYLRPLKMAEIADEVGIHESTVSRAVANKYIQTPQGTFQLKYFFTTALPTHSGGDVSSRHVKKIISDLVREEDHRHPLSDQEILTMLARRDITLARRTVAKYRKQLKIPSSRMRKRY